MAYLNVTALQMITHLQTHWGTVDFVHINELMAEVSTPWSIPRSQPSKSIEPRKPSNNWLEKRLCGIEG